MTTTSGVVPAGFSILVVEDNDTTRARIATVLRNRGHRIVEAVDGRDALEQVNAQQFDGIVLDLILPHVDGWQFRATQLVHPALAKIPTVVVTVQPLRDSARYALRTSSVLQKPFEDAELLEVVEMACQSTVAARQSRASEAPGLFWSRHGKVACADHAPDVGSSDWAQERWAPIPTFAGKGRIVYQCEYCHETRGPIARSRPDAGEQHDE
jgi:CheY-like chemotaxis protein